MQTSLLSWSMLPRNRAQRGAVLGVCIQEGGVKKACRAGEELSTLWSQPDLLGAFGKQIETESQFPLESRSPAFVYSLPKSESAFGRQSLLYPPEQGGSLSAEGISVENRGYQP